MTGPVDTLGNDFLLVEILPGCGARLHRVAHNGHDLLRTPRTVDIHERDPFDWGAYPMVPWCNRIPGARFTFDGRHYELPANFRDGSAIHGEAYAAPWQRDGDSYVFLHDGRSGFPWSYRAEVNVAVEDGAPCLTYEVRVTNTDEHAMPAGVGLHPWWNAVGGLHITVPAALVYESDGGLAHGNPKPVDGTTDLRAGRAPSWGTDTAWTDLSASRYELTWMASGLHATVAFSAVADHVVVAAFEGMKAVAVEPQTHAPDGIGRLERGERGAISVLAPSASLEMRCQLIVAV